MSGQNKYIYGIIEEPQPKEFEFLGVGDARVYTINHQKLAAIVSDTEFQEVDPTRKNVHAHTVVHDELLKSYTLLPMSFGIVAHSKEAVQGLLEKNYDSLITELKRLRGTIEVELKAFWDEKAIMKQLQNENQGLAQLKAKLQAASSPIEARILMTQAGKLVEEVVLDWQVRYAQNAFDHLKEFSVDACVNNPVGIKNILNASFLIDRAKEEKFREQVYKLDSEYQGKVNFKYVAPLPPYNFVKVGLQGAQ